MRSVKYANIFQLPKSVPVLQSLLFILTCLSAWVTAGRAQNIYSDGVDPIIVQVTANSHYEDTDVGIYNGTSSAGVCLFPAGPTPNYVSGYPGYFSPAPSSGPLVPSQFGSYTTPPTVGTKVSSTAYTDMVANVQFAVVPAGFYTVYVPGSTVYQASSSYGSTHGYGGVGQSGPIRTRFIEIDDITVVSSGTPPIQPAAPPTVYVFAAKATATKGVGDFLKFTFQRISPNNDYSNTLTVNYTVAGTAPSSDYTLNKAAPITFPAGQQTVQLKATPNANGVYDSGVTVVVTVRADTANPATYTRDRTPATGKIMSPDRPPVCSFTTMGVTQSDATNYALSIYVNQTATIKAHAHDEDGDLAAEYIDSIYDDPPNSTNGFAYASASGYDYDASKPYPFVTSGTYNFSVRALDSAGVFSSTVHLAVTIINRPPVFAWSLTNVHVLAGGTVALPYTIADPDSNLGVASASGPSGYAVQASYPDSGSGTGSFAFSAPTAGTYTITGTATDKEGLVSIVSPAITVIVEPINNAPTATFVSPAPGGANSSVTHFVDDVLSIGAIAADGDNNLASLQISLDGAAWAQAPAPAGSVSSLAASGTFTVPVLGAETSHTYTFGSVASDSGTIPGGQIVQTPQSSSTAVLTVVVPNRAPSISWTVPAGGIGQTADNPFIGYLLQPLRITAHAVDRDGNLSFENVRLESTDKGGGSNVKGRSADGRTGDVSFNFTPTKPGLYTFTGLAGDSAGSSADPISLYVLVQDYPSEGTGTIGALIVSPSNSIAHVFEPLGPPIVVKGGVAALGRDGRPKIIQNAIGVGASQIIPAPNYLNGTQIPPLTPPILDLRTVTVAPSVDHEDASAGHN